MTALIATEAEGLAGITGGAFPVSHPPILGS